MEDIFDAEAFRSNVGAMLKDELGGMLIQPGLISGPNTTHGEWIGSLYLQRVQEDPARPAELQVFMIFRAYAPFDSSSVLNANVPFDPTPLEQMSNQIQQAFARHPTGLGAWFQRVTSIEFDVEEQGVQAQIFAYSGNPSQAA
jgi:hypothetical protein